MFMQALVGCSVARFQGITVSGLDLCDGHSLISAAEAKLPNSSFDPPAEALIVDNDQSHAETVAKASNGWASIALWPFPAARASRRSPNKR